jgi:hypothetical protein
VRERIGVLVARDLDWRGFLQHVRMHQVTPLVASTLCSGYASACPREVTERLKFDARNSALRSLHLARKLFDVLDLFQAARIPVIPYKGPVLSAMGYGRVGLREFGDLDVWVHPWDYRFRVPDLLAKDGWSPAADYGWERSFRHPQRHVVLDVHQSLTHRRNLPFSLGFEEALRHWDEVEVGDRQVRTLSTPYILVTLCVQLAKDAGERDNPLPLIKVCDIAELLRSHRGLDWMTAVRVARRKGVQRVLSLGLAVATRLLGARVPEEVEQLQRQVPALPSLVHHVEERIFVHGDRPFSRPELLDASTWNAAIRERYRDRSPTMIGLLQEVLVPNEPEFALVRLPKTLFPLYRIVKPVRLALKYLKLALTAGPSDATRR